VRCLSYLVHLAASNLFVFVSSPVFVTWNIKRGDEYQLRGCIGNFSPMPLHEGLAEYALVSAFRDVRFRKIDKSELERLECA
jgi:AMMECR1 domain-containing protein